MAKTVFARVLGEGVSAAWWGGTPRGARQGGSGLLMPRIIRPTTMIVNYWIVVRLTPNTQSLKSAGAGGEAAACIQLVHKALEE